MFQLINNHHSNNPQSPDPSPQAASDNPTSQSRTSSPSCTNNKNNTSAPCRDAQAPSPRDATPQSARHSARCLASDRWPVSDDVDNMHDSG